MSKDNPVTRANSGTPPRRRFLKEVAGVAGGACLLASGVGLYSRQAQALPSTALRPPGALAEADFLAASVRCGLCVRDCPYDTLKLSELGDGIATGTPYFHLGCCHFAAQAVGPDHAARDHPAKLEKAGEGAESLERQCGLGLCEGPESPRSRKGSARRAPPARACHRLPPSRRGSFRALRA